MSDIGTGALAKKGLCQRMLLRCRFFRLISFAGSYCRVN